MLALLFSILSQYMGIQIITCTHTASTSSTNNGRATPMIDLLINLWRHMRLSLMMRGLSPEQRKKIINQAMLEVKLEQFSRSLRRVKP
jgi:hypothetical protein